MTDHKPGCQCCPDGRHNLRVQSARAADGGLVAYTLCCRCGARVVELPVTADESRFSWACASAAETPAAA